ncbi:MAG TPA: serine/threonine protein kinase [Bacilli bacterium]
MTTSFDPTFPAATTITGKWNKRAYEVVYLLGEGSNGRVYLVRRGKLLFAMKMGFDSVSLQSEINVLQALRKAEGGKDPFYIEADDFIQEGQNFPYYVMEYVRGLRAADFLQRNGNDWIYPIGSHILRKLSVLHALGWVFGDLKNENVLVSEFGRTELIDYGGVTPLGNAVKQFTEVYDRGYWAAGSRTADEGYDLFSFGVLLLQLTDDQDRIALSQQMIPQNRDVGYLLEIVRTSPLCGNVAPFLEKVFLGKYSSVKEAEGEWKACLFQAPTKQTAVLTTLPAVRVPWLTAVFAVSLALLSFTLYLTFQ